MPPRHDVDERELEVGHPKDHAAGPTAVAVAVKRAVEQMGTVRTARTLLKLNQVDGFDNHGCAWPDPEAGHRHTAEFCENGAKAVTEEATKRMLGRDFFATHPVADLAQRTDYWLGQQGRLAEPMVLRPHGTHDEPVSWEEAFETIGRAPRRLGPVTRLDRPEEEVECASRDDAAVSVLTARAVPLGGPRAMTVRRTLPQRGRTMIGAWCFVDHYGPDEVAETGGMKVAPHPHTGLQTVSWLFTGEIEHRDSAGHHAMVRPGELNLMTAGRGISHSEVSTPDTRTLHGAQLWLALPAAHRGTDPTFRHFAPDPVTGQGWEARVFLGSLLGSTSPVDTFSPLVGAELLIEADTVLDLDVDPAHEHGLLVDAGSVVVEGTPGSASDLVHVPAGCATLRVEAGEEPVRALLLGGEPLGEAIVMFWNFIGASHEEVAAFREEWQAQITRDGAVVGDSQDVADGRFGIVLDDHLAPIPSPALPNARLRERR